MKESTRMLFKGLEVLEHYAMDHVSFQTTEEYFAWRKRLARYICERRKKMGRSLYRLYVRRVGYCLESPAW